MADNDVTASAGPGEASRSIGVPELLDGAAPEQQADSPLLVAEKIAVSYGKTLALRPLSFAVPRQGLVLVLGPNGAGKTTLVKSLAGAAPLRSGSVLLRGRDVSWVPAHRRVRMGVALVPERRGTLPGLSVQENLEIGWHACPPQRRGDRKREIAQTLELFPVLADRRKQDCSTLSGGEMQMLAIARALLAKPEVLLLDEPSLGLAPLVTASVYAALAELNHRNLAIVLVEQKAVPLTRIPTTTIVLRTGNVVYQRQNARPTDDELASLYLGEGAGT